MTQHAPAARATYSHFASNSDDTMGWGEYWLKAMPRSPGVVGMTSPSGVGFAFPRDFWSMILYPERALAFDAAL
jgi:hypothetical protein